MVIVLLIFLMEGIGCASLNMIEASNDTLEMVSVFLILVNSGALLVYLGRRYENYDKMLIQFLFLSLAFKVFLLVWDYYGTAIYILPNSHADTEGYHREAVQFALGKESVSNYQLMVGLIYRLFGVQRMTAQYVNIILSFIGISYLEKSLSELNFSEETKIGTLMLSALLPNYLIMSAILLRECLISVIICIAMYYYVLWWKRNSTIYFVVALLVSFSACYFHSGAVAVTIGMATSIILTKQTEDGKRKVNISVKSVILSVVFFLIFMYLFDVFSDTLLRKFGGLTEESIDAFIEDHNLYSGAEQNSSKYYAGVSGVSGIRGILINSPIRVIYFLWVPMPWDIRGLSDIIAFCGSSLFYGGTVLLAIADVFKRNDYGLDKTRLLAFLIIALSAAFVFGWGTESAGTALRHREKFYFAYLLLYAIRFEYSRERKSKVLGYNQYYAI